MLYSVCYFQKNDKGLILSVSRKDNPNKFGLPGGKVDKGESVAHAVIRETFEETGLVIAEPIPIFASFDMIGFRNKLYICTTFISSIVSNEASSQPNEGFIDYLEPEVLIDEKYSPFYNYNKMLFQAIGLL